MPPKLRGWPPGTAGGDVKNATPAVPERIPSARDYLVTLESKRGRPTQPPVRVEPRSAMGTERRDAPPPNSKPIPESNPGTPSSSEDSVVSPAKNGSHEGVGRKPTSGEGTTARSSKKRQKNKKTVTPPVDGGGASRSEPIPKEAEGVPVKTKSEANESSERVPPVRSPEKENTPQKPVTDPEGAAESPTLEPVAGGEATEDPSEHFPDMLKEAALIYARARRDARERVIAQKSNFLSAFLRRQGIGGISAEELEREIEKDSAFAAAENTYQGLLEEIDEALDERILARIAQSDAKMTDEYVEKKIRAQRREGHAVRGSAEWGKGHGQQNVRSKKEKGRSPKEEAEEGEKTTPIITPADIEAYRSAYKEARNKKIENCKHLLRTMYIAEPLARTRIQAEQETFTAKEKGVFGEALDWWRGDQTTFSGRMKTNIRNGIITSGLIGGAMVTVGFLAPSALIGRIGARIVGGAVGIEAGRRTAQLIGHAGNAMIERKHAGDVGQVRASKGSLRDASRDVMRAEERKLINTKRLRVAQTTGAATIGIVTGMGTNTAVHAGVGMLGSVDEKYGHTPSVTTPPDKTLEVAHDAGGVGEVKEVDTIDIGRMIDKWLAGEIPRLRDPSGTPITASNPAERIIDQASKFVHKILPDVLPHDTTKHVDQSIPSEPIPSMVHLEGTYRAGESVEKVLMDTIKATHPELTKTEVGEVAHRVVLELHDNAKVAEGFGVEKGVWDRVEKGEEYKVDIDKALIEHEISHVHHEVVGDAPQKVTREHLPQKIDMVSSPDMIAITDPKDPNISYRCFVDGSCYKAEGQNIHAMQWVYAEGVASSKPIALNEIPAGVSERIEQWRQHRLRPLAVLDTPTKTQASPAEDAPQGDTSSPTEASGSDMEKGRSHASQVEVGSRNPEADLAFAQKTLPDWIGNRTRPALDSLLKSDLLNKKWRFAHQMHIRSNWGVIDKVPWRALYDRSPGIRYTVDGVDITLRPETEQYLRTFTNQLERLPDTEDLIAHAARKQWTVGQVVQAIMERERARASVVEHTDDVPPRKEGGIVRYYPDRQPFPRDTWVEQPIAPMRRGGFRMPYTGSPAAQVQAFGAIEQGPLSVGGSVNVEFHPAHGTIPYRIAPEPYTRALDRGLEVKFAFDASEVAQVFKQHPSWNGKTFGQLMQSDPEFRNVWNNAVFDVQARFSMRNGGIPRRLIEVQAPAPDTSAREALIKVKNLESQLERGPNQVGSYRSHHSTHHTRN